MGKNLGNVKEETNVVTKKATKEELLAKMKKVSGGNGVGAFKGYVLKSTSEAIKDNCFGTKAIEANKYVLTDDSTVYNMLEDYKKFLLESIKNVKNFAFANGMVKWTNQATQDIDGIKIVRNRWKLIDVVKKEDGKETVFYTVGKNEKENMEKAQEYVDTLNEGFDVKAYKEKINKAVSSATSDYAKSIFKKIK